jgi:hypothetical protein
VKDGIGVDARDCFDVARRCRTNNDLLHQSPKQLEKQSSQNTPTKNAPDVLRGVCRISL